MSASDTPSAHDGGRTPPRGAHDGYVCGHSPEERDRLDIQGAFYADITQRALADGGIVPGMRVLDLGCGTGSVTLLTAERVGASGAVTGVDRDPEALAAAHARAQALGVRNVSFVQAELGGEGATAEAPEGDADIGLEGPFDALVGRFFLMHQDDPAAILARAARLVRRGGRIVMLESAMGTLLTAPSSEPPCPLFDHTVRWKCAVVGAAGADLLAGLHLRRTFLAAGLPAPTARMEARLEGGLESPLYRYYAESVRSMLPLAERFGIEGFTAGDLDTLEDALRMAVVEGGHTLVSWPVVSAWCERT